MYRPCSNFRIVHLYIASQVKLEGSEGDFEMTGFGLGLPFNIFLAVPVAGWLNLSPFFA